MEEELSVEFETRLRDLDVMVKRRLAALRAGEDDAAAITARGRLTKIQRSRSRSF